MAATAKLDLSRKRKIPFIIRLDAAEEAMVSRYVAHPTSLSYRRLALAIRWYDKEMAVLKNLPAGKPRHITAHLA